jgi:hypothetical protein
MILAYKHLGYVGLVTNFAGLVSLRVLLGFESAFRSCRRADDLLHHVLPVGILYSRGALAKVFCLHLTYLFSSIMLSQDLPYSCQRHRCV